MSFESLYLGSHFFHFIWTGWTWEMEIDVILVTAISTLIPTSPGPGR